MFLKNAVGRDSVWEAEQRGNEELVRWMLAFGEERATGEIAEVDDGEEGPEDEEGEVEEVTMRAGVSGSGAMNKEGDSA